MARGILIGVAGGSGSGKTLVVQHMIEQLGSARLVVLQQDSYYKDSSHLPFEERAKQNFDHPDAIDSDLLVQHVEELLSGWTVDIPIYDFTTHTRRAETRRAGPHDIIVLEGILILDNPRLRELMDIKVYVDTDPDIRFIRRLKRDTAERGRTMQSVVEQYEKSVRPMHLQFVEPTKRYADIIVPEGGYNWVAIDLLKTKVEALLRERR
ncbi:uridine kinase [candidate division KSB1 bacterium]|nr:uridine kinase [candidate division KSB1 bacterium]